MEWSWAFLLAGGVGLRFGWQLLYLMFAVCARLEVPWRWNLTLGTLVVSTAGLGISLRAAFVYGATSLYSALIATLLAGAFLGVGGTLAHFVYKAQKNSAR